MVKFFQGEADWYSPAQDNEDDLATICVGDYEFFENSEIADGMIKESSLPDKFKIKNWRKSSLNCPKHRND